MKNRNQEKARQRSYARARKPWKGHFHQGVKIIHVYPGFGPLSWWDDFAFRMGKEHCWVFWRHPRYVISEMLMDMEIDPDPSKWQEGFTPTVNLAIPIHSKRAKDYRFYEWVWPLEIRNETDVHKAYEIFRKHLEEWKKGAPTPPHGYTISDYIHDFQSIQET